MQYPTCTRNSWAEADASPSDPIWDLQQSHISVAAEAAFEIIKIIYNPHEYLMTCGCCSV